MTFFPLNPCPSLIHHWQVNSLHTTRLFLLYAGAARVSWLNFHSKLPLKIVHFWSYTENTMFILNYCYDFLKSIFHFPLQFLNVFV